MSENAVIAVMGGKTEKILLVDGTLVDVLIRQLPIRTMEIYAGLLTANDQAALVELFCSQPAGWADTVSHESLEVILKKGEEVNLDFLQRWLERKSKNQVAMPRTARELAVDAMIKEQMEKVTSQFSERLQQLVPSLATPTKNS
jgi:5,10-methenyltetrahydromethanopterin hydrogenase